MGNKSHAFLAGLFALFFGVAAVVALVWLRGNQERLREYVVVTKYSIGGLNPDRLAAVFENGADSAAVVTDITLNADPEARTREWITRTERWR